ncbi:MAG: hypothetical protein II675_03620 [Bacteroidaceae bacterium]|nr:hypothetical protein [Bacteroidaceae bacterium]
MKKTYVTPEAFAVCLSANSIIALSVYDGSQTELKNVDADKDAPALVKGGSSVWDEEW